MSDKFSIAINRQYSGKIPKDAPKSLWRAFNGQFKTVTTDLKGLIHEIKAGHAFTAALNGYRKTENFVSAQHIGLDFDTDDQRSALDTLAADPFIARWAAIIYTSPSHTPEKPRARVVFILDQAITDPEQYKRLARGLVGKYELVDKHGKDAARLWFASKGCEIRELGNVLPLAVAEEYAAAFTPEKPVNIPKGKREYNPTDETEKAKYALEALAPWRCSQYEPWVEVGMSLKSLGNAGLVLWDEWSKGDPEQYDPGECKYKFGTFTADGITLGSLFHWADEDSPGWRSNLPGDNGANHDLHKQIDLSKEPPMPEDPPESISDETSEPATWADLEGVLGPITWDWQPWLPQGMLTILAGESGSGKSALALRLGACYLRGDAWPDGMPYGGQVKRILWCEAEAAQAVNFERAKKWGLPMDHIFTPFANPLVDIRLDEAGHQAALRVLAEREDIGLIVIDSLRGANTKDENSSETMGMVKWLAELARDSGKPILLTHHLRKRGVFDLDGVDLERLRGSSAIVQAARVVWALDTPDAQDKANKRLQVVKSNLAKFPDPVGMTISDIGVTFGIAPEPPRIETVADKAADLLLALLSDDPMQSDNLRTEVEKAGVSWRSAQRAKAKLGIVSIKREDGRWYWSLPARDEHVN